MTDFVFNIAKGTGVHLLRSASATPPGNGYHLGALLLIKTGSGGDLVGEDTLKDYLTVAALLAPTTNDEPSAGWYARKALGTDGSGFTISQDNTANTERVDISPTTITWTSASTGTSVVKLVMFAYPTSLTGADSVAIPLTCHDLVFDTNGTSVDAVSTGVYVGA